MEAALASLFLPYRIPLVSKTYIPAETRRRVAKTARHRCGYCLSAQHIVGFPMHVEHILPEMERRRHKDHRQNANRTSHSDCFAI